MTTANRITLLRIAMIPVFLAMLLIDFPYHDLVALAVFAAASLTDHLDGYIARKYNQITTFGKFVDPLADKLLVISALMVFVQQGKMPAIAAMIIVARELIITSLRVLAMSEGVVMAAGTSGKIKTATQMTCIMLMLLTPTFGVWFPYAGTEQIYEMGSWVMALVTLWSGTEYCLRNKDLILKSK